MSSFALTANKKILLFLCRLNVLRIVFSCSLQKVTIFLFFFLLNFLLCLRHICFVVLISQVFNVPIFSYYFSYLLLKNIRLSSFFSNIVDLIFNFNMSNFHLLLLHSKSIDLLLLHKSANAVDIHNQFRYRIPI